MNLTVKAGKNGYHQGTGQGRPGRGNEDGNRRDQVGVGREYWEKRLDSGASLEGTRILEQWELPGLCEDGPN